MEFNVPTSSTRIVQITLPGNTLVMKFPPGKPGFQIPSQPYWKRLISHLYVIQPLIFSVGYRSWRRDRVQIFVYVCGFSLCIPQPADQVCWDQMLPKPFGRRSRMDWCRPWFVLQLEYYIVNDLLTINPSTARFVDLCEITADVTKVKNSIQREYNPRGGVPFYQLKFDVVLLFGLTELKAQIAWIENVRCLLPFPMTKYLWRCATGSGETVRWWRTWQTTCLFWPLDSRGPASVVYDPDSVLSP